MPDLLRETIIGHGRRRKQALDERHDSIWIRRGRCPVCKMTFTILPTWSRPSGHYSYGCRQQASELRSQASSWEQSAPYCKDPDRLPDPATLRRWACRKLISLWVCATSGLAVMASPSLFSAPTILAWDCVAAGRILRLEAGSP